MPDFFYVKIKALFEIKIEKKYSSYLQNLTTLFSDQVLNIPKVFNIPS